MAGDADLGQVAAAIIFGKGMNGGQTCIAPDYVLVESRHISGLVKALSHAIQQQRPDDHAATSPIDAAHQQRQEAMLKEAHDHGCRIIDLPHPLALYAFTHDKGLQQQLLETTLSGALVFNTTLLHHAVPSLPFGGVGESGMGAYHGRHGFERFSHLRSVFYQSKRTPSHMFYPPYRRWLMKLIGLG